MDVQRHKKFLRLRMSWWDAEIFRNEFKKEELILHLLLMEELFYVWREDGSKRVLAYAQDAYPDTTLGDVIKIYQDNFDDIIDIYG